MTARVRTLLVTAVAGAGSLFLACATTPPAPLQRAPLPADLSAYLPAPSQLVADGPVAAIDPLHRRLLAGEPPSGLRAELLALLAEHPGAARLLLAEIALVEGSAEMAVDELAAMAPADAARPAAHLVRGRAAELQQDLVGAVLSFRIAARQFGLADERARELEPRAVERLHARIRAGLAAGSAAATGADAELLAEWRPDDPRSWRAVVETARAVGADGRELAARRELARLGGEDLADQLRRGSLEVDHGDANAGLSLLESLAASRGELPEVRASWRRARFQFRLTNAPEEVRRAVSLPVLTRADFARLLFWLVPEVRTARADVVRIATDVFDHPAREELVRIANLGLLEIDESLHLFEPERPLRRREAFAALLRVLNGEIGSRDRSGAVAEICSGAVLAGWIAESGECLPAAPVAGAEARLWIAAAVAPREGEGA